MRIKMKRTCNFRPPEAPTTRIKFREGREYTTRRGWGAAMAASGHAEELEPPGRQASAKDEPGSSAPAVEGGGPADPLELSGDDA